MAFSYYKTATVDHVQCGSAGALANFPVCVWITDTDLKTVGNGGFVQNANGYDIRPYADSALTTALSFELVYFNAATGQIEMHVNAGTGASQVTSASDAVIYLAFGDASISTDGSSTGAWNSNYKLVLHYPNGSTLALTDSTATPATGTNNSATAGTGQIDGCATFNGSSQYIDYGTPAKLALTASFSSSAWVYRNGAAGAGITTFGNGREGTTGWGSGVNDSGNHSFIKFSAIAVDSSIASPSTTWEHVTWTVDSGNKPRLYINGVLQFTSGFTEGGFDIVSPAQSATVGAVNAFGSGKTEYWPGSLDEARVSATQLSVSWILSEFNNQKTSSTFITWGSKISAGLATPPKPTVAFREILPYMIEE